MKKNILLLINGFGIEQADSYDIYSPELMPNFDALTKEGIFTSIPNNYYDYKSAYQNFSIGTNEQLTYSLVENNLMNDEYKNNQVLKYIIQETNNKNSDLHVVCYWDNDKFIEQFNYYINELKDSIKNKIFIHLILCQQSIKEYSNIDNGVSKMAYDLGNNVKIGVVTGINNFSNDLSLKEAMRCFLTEAGEKWKDVTKKTKVLCDSKIKPCDAKTFAANYGFGIKENDQMLFFNYSNFDVTGIVKEMKEQKYRKFDSSTVGLYSLFPLKSDPQIPFMYNFAVSSTYFLKSLQSINASCVIMDKKEKCIATNYFMTGLRNETAENIKYSITDDDYIYDSEKLLEKIKELNKDIYIINYYIDDCDTLEKMQERLQNIDKAIGPVIKYCSENNYGLFASSLYGLEKEVVDSTYQVRRINFSTKVPLVILDKDIAANNYSIKEGNLYDLSNTIIFNTNNEYKEMGLLKKKSKLFSFLYKKK